MAVATVDGDGEGDGGVRAVDALLGVLARASKYMFYCVMRLGCASTTSIAQHATACSSSGARRRHSPRPRASCTGAPHHDKYCAAVASGPHISSPVPLTVAHDDHDVHDTMKSSALIVLLSVALSAQASWFGADSSSSSASAQASAWSAEQYAKAQRVFHGLKADAFDTWDESRLREFLLEQGVVEPKGTREQLSVLARQKYASFTSAASVYSASATSLASDASASATSLTSKASKSATSLASEASKSASTAVYGDSKYQASKSVSSTYAQATNDISRKLDDTKDYVYST